jgi:hypothetical protein
MKQIDKIKHQQYGTEMKIIALEEKQKQSKLSKNEEKELEFLRTKLTGLEYKIESML